MWSNAFPVEGSMSNFIEQLLADTPQGRREQVRAKLRVAVTEGLLAYMQGSGVTKTELARRIGVTRSAVTQALAGNRNLTLNALADISDALCIVPNIHFTSLSADVLDAIRRAVALNSNIEPSAGNIILAREHFGNSPAVMIRADLKADHVQPVTVQPVTVQFGDVHEPHAIA